MVLKYVTKNGMPIHEPPYTQAGEDSSTGASAVVRLLLPAQPVAVKRANETTMDLEQIINELVYRKKKVDLDSPERQLIDRILTGLRYSYEEAGGIIEDLDFDWGASCRCYVPPLGKPYSIIKQQTKTKKTSKADPPPEQRPKGGQPPYPCLIEPLPDVNSRTSR